MKLDIFRKNAKTEDTRMYIAEAAIQLLKHTPISKIKIQDVAKRAGVSRMTFYNYYQSVRDALEDYMHIIAHRYIENFSEEGIKVLRQHKSLVSLIDFMDQYRDYFLVLKQNGLQCIFMDATNLVMKKIATINGVEMNFGMYHYAGGFLNAFLQWEEDKGNMTSSDLADSILKVYSLS